MIVRYALEPERSYSEQCTSISEAHVFGDILLAVDSRLEKPAPSALRLLHARHSLMVEISDGREETIRSWLDAGAQQVWVPAEPLDSISSIFPEGRVLAAPSKLATSVEQCRSQIKNRNPVIPSEFSKEVIGEYLLETAKTDRPDQLIPTLVCDEWGIALGLCYSNRESILASLETGKGVYWSRSRNELWEKGKTSGAEQKILRIDLDCDSDTLRFTVKQQPPGFCHLERRNCFSAIEGDLGFLERHLMERLAAADDQSYTARLLRDPQLLRAKIREEAEEFIEANDREASIWEAADLLYFTLVQLIARNVDCFDVVAELLRRTRKISRRPGNAKKQFID